MQYGALAMFDALGFKGIWNRPETKADPDAVILKLRELEREANAEIDRAFQGIDQAVKNSGHVLGQASFSFLSDTIVLGFKAKPAFGEAWATALVLWAAHFVQRVAKRAALTLPTLAYRGCITVGQFTLEDNFIVGPAVDDAAANMDRAQGAFVWLTPQADAALDWSSTSPMVPPHYPLMPYAVPMKGGDVFDTHAVLPFELGGAPADAAALTRGILESFHGGVDVMIKRQNTERFLQAAAERMWPPT